MRGAQNRSDISVIADIPGDLSPAAKCATSTNAPEANSAIAMIFTKPTITSFNMAFKDAPSPNFLTMELSLVFAKSTTPRERQLYAS